MKLLGSHVTQTVPCQIQKFKLPLLQPSPSGTALSRSVELLQSHSAHSLAHQPLVPLKIPEDVLKELRAERQAGALEVIPHTLQVLEWS